jgi:hypothetical protein
VPVVVLVPIPKGAAYWPATLPFSVEALPDTSDQVTSPNVKLLSPAESEAKYCGSAGPGVSVTVTAPATPVSPSQADPVVTNNILRMFQIPLEHHPPYNLSVALQIGQVNSRVVWSKKRES